MTRKAMPVMLRTEEEVDIWMSAPWPDAVKLQRPLPDGSLRIVGHGARQDGPVFTEPAAAPY